MARWESDDFERTGITSARAAFQWLRQGLADWRDPHATYRAFEPINDRFDPTDDAEPQIRDMFRVIPEWQRVLLIDGIACGFREAEPNLVGHRLFDSLQRLVRLIQRPEPADVMVERVTTTSFLDEADEAVARHLYAGCFVTLAEVSQGAEGMSLIARLVASPRFRFAYVPFIVERIGGNSAKLLLDYIGLLLSDSSGAVVYDRAVADAVAGAAQSLSPLDMMDMLEKEAHLWSLPTSPLDEILRDGFKPQIELLAGAQSRIEMAHRGGNPTPLDRQLNATYYDMSWSKSRVLTREVRLARARLTGFAIEVAEEKPLGGVLNAVDRRLAEPAS